MKRWVWYVIGSIVFALALGGVLYGVLTHKEAGLMKVCWQNGWAHYDGECMELKWQKEQMPLSYHIAFGESHKDYVDSVLKAAEMWNREITPVFKRVDNEADASVLVFWGAVPKEGHTGGHTAHTGTDGPISARIILAEPSDIHAVYRYAAHEFGHVLGLAHDEAPRSIMYPVQPGMTDKMQFVLPSDHDRKLLKQLYR